MREILLLIATNLLAALARVFGAGSSRSLMTTDTDCVTEYGHSARALTVDSTGEERGRLQKQQL